MLLTNFMSFFFPAMFAVNPDCNYRQNMQTGVTYYVYNNEYPSNYPPGKTCRWIGIAPTNMKIQLTCNLEMPQVLPNVIIISWYSLFFCLEYRVSI